MNSDGHDGIDDDFADDSLPPEIETLVSPEKLTYAPWHRPRKQYVRKEQWARHTLGIINKLKGLNYFEHGTPLKYLTLPGPDLLDLSMVAEICEKEAIQLRYTGFCYTDEKEQTRLRRNISEFTVQRQKSVFHGSKIVDSKIQDVMKKRSGARVEMEKGGPFDIVNIDACEPIANNDADATGRLVDAIRCITEYQLEKSRHPWMLFLTTPIQTNIISSESLDALHNQIISNAEKDNEFAERLYDALLSNSAELKDFLAKATSANGIDLVRVFSLGVSKWLLHMAEQANFGLKKMKGHCYCMFKKEPFDPNMVSLCFLFYPSTIVIEDKSGLTRNPAGTTGTAGISDHVRVLNQSMNVDSLDIILDGDATLLATLIKETKDQLRAVGYPVDDPELGYDAWLSKEPTYVEKAVAS